MNQSSQQELIPIIVGTAGHIDHGKTRLVRALTGTNTDRLPEEIKRGISIDLGFASWKSPEFQFNVIDVPGHERFVRNMVAGATGINLALLVVAGDDGVMPQTREHLNILQLLGVQTGLIAITKADLADSDYLDLVESEIRELIADTFLRDCPIVRVSSTTGAGIDDLRQALLRIAAVSPRMEQRSVFRMPIDNVFSKSGQGTIVTGSILSGTVDVDQKLELLPSGTLVRIRAIQQQKHEVSSSFVRHRAGLNLANTKVEDVHRGLELATPGYLKPTQRLLVSINFLRGVSGSAARNELIRKNCQSGASVDRVCEKDQVELRDRMTLKLHLATSEVNARLMLKGQRFSPGESGYTELRIARPIVAEYGQRFILRTLSPALTIAGGRILDPQLDFRLSVTSLQTTAVQCDSHDPALRLAALISSRRVCDFKTLEMSCRTGIDPLHIPKHLDELRIRNLIRNLGTPQSPRWIHASTWNLAVENARTQIRQLMQQNHPRRSLPIAMVVNRIRAVLGDDLSDPIEAELVHTGWLIRSGENYGPADQCIQLSKRQQELRSQLMKTIELSGLVPPSLRELSEKLQQPVEKLQPLLQLDVDEGGIIKLGDDIYCSIAVLESIRKVCIGWFHATPSATVGQLRDAWKVTRKYAIPFIEWLDTQGIIVREGDLRYPGPNLGVPLG